MFQEGKIDASTAMQMLAANQTSMVVNKRPLEEAPEANGTEASNKQAKVMKPPDSWAPCQRYYRMVVC